LDWIKAKKVFDKGKLLTLKWVVTCKSNGSVRSRLVLREVKKAKKIEDQLEPQDLFSAMPPVESLKALVSHMMTEQTDEDGEDLVCGLFDASRAHFNVEAERELHANLPEEMAEDGFCPRLKRTMYG